MISVFTPSHDPKYLDDALYSLLSQTYADWEWVVLLNSGAKWKPDNDDERIKIHYEKDESGCVGFYKKAAVALCQGDILVELDHDDYLTPNALELVQKAFDENPEVGFVYSDTCQVAEDGSPEPSNYSPLFGWDYYSWTDNIGVTHQIANTKQPHPHNVNLIWFAPNHIRAFRKDVYERAGGYNRVLKVLDDQDLMRKIYEISDFYKLPEPVYFQRVHSGNTQSREDLNGFIQNETVRMYLNHIENSAKAWAERNHLACLDLGAAHGKPEGYIGVDIIERPGVDIVSDFMELDMDNLAGVIRAHDFIEHLPNGQKTMEKIYDTLVDGGMAFILVPSTDGRGAFQDPTHISFWNENSFWYYTRAETAAFINTYARFQVGHIETFFPSDWHRENNISYVLAILIAVKDNQRKYGGILSI